MPYLSIFGLEFENDIVIFEFSTLEYVKLENRSATYCNEKLYKMKSLILIKKLNLCMSVLIA